MISPDGCVGSTDFGHELEVCGWTQTTGGHQAKMLHEMQGKFGALNDVPNRPSNHWSIITGEVVCNELPSATMVDTESIVLRIQQTLGSGSVNGIKNLGRAFRAGDESSCGLITKRHFEEAMAKFGVRLTAGESSPSLTIRSLLGCTLFALTIHSLLAQYSLTIRLQARAQRCRTHSQHRMVWRTYPSW